jgi:hypothetical protein
MADFGMNDGSSVGKDGLRVRRRFGIIGDGALLFSY